ncbi:MAG: hypothetical protein IJO60_12605 [Agathobacter sp.]|nr:hypothetical protein [Agathobacter sp.]
MAKINNKAVKTIAKLMEEGYATEKEIQAMTIDEMLLLPGISVAEIGMINELQKAIKANKVISYLGGEEKNG